jgi:uncharacterized membrane protein
MSILEVSRIIFGGMFVLFLPGFAWSFVFFTRKNIDLIERIALSFGLSIALVPLSVFWLNWLFYMKISILNTSLTVCGLIIVAAIYIIARKQSWGKSITNKFRSIFQHTRQDKS